MKQLLIVDDSKAMRTIVRRALQQSNLGEHQIVEATDGQDALDKLHAGQFDLVLADWNMPEMSGIDLLKAIRAENNQVTFGFITSEGTSDIHELATQNGAQFFIVKPFSRDAINAALAQVGLV